MLAQLEHTAAIDPFTFKNATGIMQPMRQHMDAGVAPGNDLSIEPDGSIAVVKGNKGSHVGFLGWLGLRSGLKRRCMR